VSLSPAEHRRLIQDRLARSEVWRVIHALGSLKLAVVLLVTISLACAVATFMESSFSIKVARYYIYDAPWFLFWLGLLVANLICAALTRWPWQRRHVGFVITHGGIILVLLGALIGQQRGFEGVVTLKQGAEPSGTLVIDETILQVESPVSGLLYQTELPVEVRRPSPQRPRHMPVPDSPLKLVIDDYVTDLAVRLRVEADPTAAGLAGMELVLSSQRMGQTLPVSLALAPVEARSFDLFGLARVELVERLPSLPKAAPQQALEFRETHMVFARMPQTPVTHSTLGRPSGYGFILEQVADTDFQLRILRPDGSSEVRPLMEVLDRPFTDAQGTIFHVMNYWPDLRMVDGRPVSVSDRPNNPAVLVTLAGRLVETDRSPPVLRLAPGRDGSVDYQLIRGGTLNGQGTVRPGESFLTGWADWSVALREFYPSARIRTVAERASQGPSMKANEGTVPGIRVALAAPDGSLGEATWIPSGTSRVVEVGGHAVRVGFGLKTHRLDFLVSLERFEVPRDEGSNEPANFISDVRFDGREGGPPVRARIQMNHPASYPPAWWQTWLGMNYKFSQAGWNPEELDTTTLQVLHDPGWPLKWFGSLLICGGIFALFYLKPREKGTRDQRPAHPEPASHL
jgi:hypothetical protein